ncbi:MAG TPA: glycosyltransferase family 4 protein [Chthonomonadaceae bacterium]|nr:glycosyltransferase family 4 protein [Chthonomonadaceae bacterium]
MKVAMLTTVGERCGIAAYTRALIAGLQTLPDMEIEVVPITEGRQPTAHYVEQAERLNAPDVDVVHIQHEYSFWGGVLPKTSGYWELRYLIQKPVVLTGHTTYDLADLLKLRAERRPHKWLAKQILVHNRAYRESIEIAPFVTAFTIVHTEAARQALIARGAKPAYVVVVPAGIPEPLPAPTHGEAFRQRFGLEGRRAVTIFGYLSWNKGYELTLQILPSLPDDVVFVIAGGARTEEMAPYEAQLRESIARAGLENRVILTGFLSDEDVSEAMAASEIVLVPHTQATGSYSVTIPLSHGKPILASDLDCFREIKERVDCLELFRAGDVADYRAKLLSLLDDPARRKTLSANALKYARRFSWANVAARTHDVYEAAIEVYSRGHHTHAPL